MSLLSPPESKDYTQSIDFTLMVGEDTSEVAALLATENLIAEADVAEVTERLSSIILCVEDVTKNDDLKILAQTRADLADRLSHDK